MSVNTQLDSVWQHIVIVDGGFPMDSGLLHGIQRPNRTIICLGARCQNFGNTPRHIGWKLADKDYCIYLDDDNYFTRPDALADISRALDGPRPDWAVFPIMRHGSRFFSEDPRCCHVDTANMVIKREIAQWPNRDEYTLDGIFCDELKSRYPYIAFPEVAPIIDVPVMSRGL